MGEHTFDANAVPERLRELPGGPELLDLASGRSDVALVGGAVRDLLLDRPPRELDVVVVGDDPSFAPAFLFARELAGRLGVRARIEQHERFGTALVTRDGAQVDIAGARCEHYETPGTLPLVGPATLDRDLLRRDFTVNAIAVTLDGRRPGEAHAPPGALEDLRAGRLRVLHDASFLDDPTRLLRLARYAARLGFEIEAETSALAVRALNARALDTVSGVRIGAELRLAANEAHAIGSFAEMDRLGLLSALHPRLRFDRAAIQRALALLPDDGRRDLLILAALMLPLTLRADDSHAEITALLDRFEFTAPDRERIVASAGAVPRLTDVLVSADAAGDGGAARPSRLRTVLAGVPVEGIALAGGVSAHCAEPTGRWLGGLREVTLSITGEDLLAAGIPEGPEIGRRLDAALDRKLDREISGGREAELAAALESRT